MARPSNTDVRRREIVQALAQVMARRGYDGASTVEIARAAGLAPGLVHYHFSTKEEILLALVEHLRRVVRGRFEKRVGPRSSANDRLAAFIDAHVALGPDADPAAMACWVSIAAEAVRRPDVKALYRRVANAQSAELRDIVGTALAEAGRSTARAASISAAILSAIQGAYQLGVAAPGVIPPGAAAPMIRRMAQGLIRGEPRSRRRK